MVKCSQWEQEGASWVMWVHVGLSSDDRLVLERFDKFWLDLRGGNRWEIVGRD